MKFWIPNTNRCVQKMSEADHIMQNSRKCLVVTVPSKRPDQRVIAIQYRLLLIIDSMTLKHTTEDPTRKQKSDRSTFWKYIWTFFCIWNSIPGNRSIRCTNITSLQYNFIDIRNQRIHLNTTSIAHKIKLRNLFLMRFRISTERKLLKNP